MSNNVLHRMNNLVLGVILYIVPYGSYMSILTSFGSFHFLVECGDLLK